MWVEIRVKASLSSPNFKATVSFWLVPKENQVALRMNLKMKLSN